MATYLPKANALFLHVPRTGGMWFKSMLKVVNIEHRQYRHYRTRQFSRQEMMHCLLGHYDFSDLASPKFLRAFAFVRHPIAYYESAWKWCEYGRLRRAWLWHPFMAAQQLFDHDFNRWVEQMIKLEPAWYTRLLEAFVGPNNAEFCFFVGRTERLVEDAIFVLENLGYTLSDRHRDLMRSSKPINASRNKARLKWDQGLADEVLHLERIVVDRFYKCDHRLMPGSRLCCEYHD